MCLNRRVNSISWKNMEIRRFELEMVIDLE